MKKAFHSFARVRLQSVSFKTASLVLVLGFIRCTAQVVDWQSPIGGTNDDFFFGAAVSGDGGSVHAGFTYSGSSGNKTSALNGDGDFWLAKLDANGVKQWDRSYGGDSFDGAYSVQRTSDGGYILGGDSYSGVSGNKTNAAIGSGDGWLVKTDAAGNKQWERVFGGMMYDGIFVVRTNSDGGYMLVGQSYSGADGNKTNANLGEGDYWLIKTDANGDKVWERVFGGDGDDYPYAMESTGDGGFIIGGSSASGISGNKTNDTFGDYDYWIVKVDSNGDKEWERVFGGDGWDEVNDIKPTSDGGYIVAGSSESGANGNKDTPNFGFWDWWVVKLDGNGDKQWEVVLGGTNDQDYLNRVLETSDGGYLLAGTSWSNASGNKTNENIGNSDFWLVKLDSEGNKEWEQAYGGINEDYPWVLEPAGDGGFLLGGHSDSGMTGTKTSANFGGLDGWVLKLSSVVMAPPTLTIMRSPPSNVVVAWPSSATTYAIQHNMQIGTTNWSAPPEGVSDDGTNKSITITSHQGQRYFRLMKFP